MNGGKYTPSNKEESNTAIDHENCIPLHNVDYFSHSKTLIESEEKRQSEHHETQAIPSEGIGHQSNQDITRAPLTEQSRISLWEKEQHLHPNIVENDKSSKIDYDVSNLMPSITIDQYQDNIHLLSSYLEEQVSTEETKDLDVGKRFSYVADDDLEVAGPSYVTCDVCKKRFETKYFLEQHQTIHTSEDSLLTEICDNVWSKRKDSKHPKLSHTTKKIHKCDQCHKIYSSKQRLVEHKRTHTENDLYKCDKCGKSLSGKYNLKRHLKFCGSSLEERQYQCDECHIKFFRKEHLESHFRIHTGEKPFECKKCHKTFSRKDYLEKHHSIHTHEKPFGCRKCHKTFSRIECLEKHFSIHTREKPFECRKCPKTFSRKEYLDKHNLTHEKPFECRKCRKKFALKDGLKAHYWFHNEETPYKCEKCGKCFSTSFNCRRHEKKCADPQKKERNE